MISYVLPTRDRPELLHRTLGAIGHLDGAAHEHAGGGEVIVIDNASRTPAEAARTLDNGLEVRVIRREANEAAAGRNVGAREARGAWIVMLDDDSWPLTTGHLDAIADAPQDVAAIGAEIFLPGGAREAGGLPEVFTGCGVAVRREAFLGAGGYDPRFHYYAEEYDLSAQLLRSGLHIVHDRRFRVLHQKATAGRSMNVILRRLVRNNAWIMQRYAPPHERAARIRETIARYGRIAVKERAVTGYARGVLELAATIHGQPNRTMDRPTFDRFTGLAAARAHLRREASRLGLERVAIVDEGKNAWAIRRAAADAGLQIIADERAADAVLVGTLSPGPMLDSVERREKRGERVIAPWLLLGAPEPSSARAAA